MDLSRVASRLVIADVSSLPSSAPWRHLHRLPRHVHVWFEGGRKQGEAADELFMDETVTHDLMPCKAFIFSVLEAFIVMSFYDVYPLVGHNI